MGPPHPTGTLHEEARCSDSETTDSLPITNNSEMYGCRPIYHSTEQWDGIYNIDDILLSTENPLHFIRSSLLLKPED